LKKSDMLKKNKEFKYVAFKGSSVASKTTVLKYAKNRTGVKIGLSVSAKLGNAVVRNRTKRVMRAALTPLLPKLKKNTAYLFIARNALVGHKTDYVQNEMLCLLHQAGVIDEKSD